MTTPSVARHTAAHASAQTRCSVVFIGGKGRSGSTLLARLLSQDPSVVSVGELELIADRGYFGNQLCSCSEPFRACPFWQDVLSILAGPHTDRWFHEFASLQSCVARMRRAPLVFSAATARPLRSRKQVAYQGMLEELIQAIVAVTGGGTVVDSSKNPVHGAYLSMCQSVQLSLIHLIRDSRAVAFSLQRKRVRPEIVGGTTLMPRATTRRATLDWDLRNLLTHVVAPLSDRHRRVLYEKLVEDADGTRDSLLSWIGTNLTNSEEEGGSKPKKAPIMTHEVSGNPMRFRGSSISIEPDVEWMQDMRESSYAACTALSAPLLLYYGYHLSRR